jgi:high-affinity Fe2+/Pb2+ permease
VRNQEWGVRSMKWKQFNLIIFPLLALIFFLLVASANHHVFNNENAVMYTYMQSFRHGHIGYGFNSYYANNISFAGLEQGCGRQV